MIKGFKIRLKPTKEQEELMWKHAAAARQVWNWALAVNMQRFEDHEKFLTGYDLKKLLTQEKKTNELWKSVACRATSQVLLDQDLAWKDFFRYHKSGKNQKFSKNCKKKTVYNMVKHPKFKSCKTTKPSFYVNYESVYFKNGTVNIEKIGKVSFKTNFVLPEGKASEHTVLSNPRVSYVNGKWILSFGMEVESETKELNDYSLGIDLGIKSLAVCSYDGRILVFGNVNKEKRTRKIKRALRLQQKDFSRKLLKEVKEKPRSNRAKKSQRRVAKLYYRLANIRKDHIHKATRKVVELLPQRIVVEDLNIRGMMSNRHLARAIQEQCFYLFLSCLKNKADEYGIKIVKADRFYPSSKTCSRCGKVKKKLKLSERTYTCDHCGNSLDRDINAAINLENYNT